MRLFVSSLIIIAFGIGGFVITIMAALSRDAEFYVPFYIIITIGLIIIAILAIYGQLKKKIPKMGTIVFLILCAISWAAFEGYQTYLKSLEVVSTQDVDLSAYRPFIENTKAVSLGEESTFKIEDNLPKLDGATALYPVYSAFAQAVYPEKEYSLENSEVVSNQTSRAFDRLLNGEADIIFIAQPSQGQMDMAKRMGIELHMTPIGREAFVFFVHSDNPVDELTIEQIQGIYSGKITNWNQVGGKDEEIRAFQRPEGSGSQSALLNLMGNTPLMDPPSEDIVSAMGGIIRETTNYQNRTNAIGYSFRFFSQQMVQDGKIKFIAVEGVEPSKENIKNGTYPIIGEFYAITSSTGNPHVEEFIEWMQSEQGQKIIDLTGYVPVD
ncbi:MAG TPA: PstS family phosphate ABC transporter substrate-binding protein [Bacillus sp. (in: firmicutes)]|uniref:PstS family phosphate ABC transporter substrate-binding protein n=1 Tax=Bacillus litorisediminis TaxID=2922713 RepID=UPI001FB02F7F|nr:PstS family phosphate ABC transporter substrate-binding protein [Bacillus litorisediminis]HWO75421.1 PstS family phosphate ABC transporter substrate-binding protein [Bacillus sp. (in: firmicutes)]